MGKNWDKKQDFTPIWKECFRVLKPGGFSYIMNAPRSDCQLLLLTELVTAGFNIEFTPMYWTYASGFPKAANMSKLIDKSFFNTWFKKHYGHIIEKYKEGLSQVKGNKEKTKEIKELFTQFKNSKKPEWALLEYGIHQEQTKYEHPGRKNRSYQTKPSVFSGNRKGDKIENNQITKPSSPEAKKMKGSYAGLQPKPAVEVINVVMKPLSEKSYINQALKDGKGVSWFDDCRIPYTELQDIPRSQGKPCHPSDSGIYNWNNPKLQKFKKKMVGERPNHHYSAGGEDMGGFNPMDNANINLKGRFPANLLVSDDILDMGKNIRGGINKSTASSIFGTKLKQKTDWVGETKGDFSRYFSLDAWWDEHVKNLPKEVQQTFPFLYSPKPTKKEKNKGLTGKGKKVNDGRDAKVDNAFQRGETVRKNTHPTGKPIKLMAYLIILGSRPGDIILDPFAGTGTTGIACKLEDRIFIMIEKDEEYFQIMKSRLRAYKLQKKLL